MPNWDALDCNMNRDQYSALAVKNGKSLGICRRYESDVSAQRDNVITQLAEPIVLKAWSWSTFDIARFSLFRISPTQRGECFVYVRTT
jgi:hypothetical protein